MRALVQRVSGASVRVEGEVVGQVGLGLLVFLGVGHADTAATARKLAEKVAKLRVFGDEAGKLNRDLREVGGRVLSVSQFTLYGDTRKGNRPSFVSAAPPAQGEALYEAFNAALRDLGLNVQMGRFGAHMEVELVNDGPVTLLLEMEEPG